MRVRADERASIAASEGSGVRPWVEQCIERAIAPSWPRGEQACAEKEKGGECGWAAGQAKPGREGEKRAEPGREKEKGLGQNLGLGQNGRKGDFSKTKTFFQFYFSFLSQIQIEFEFNFKSSSPTLNQKQYASA